MVVVTVVVVFEQLFWLLIIFRPKTPRHSFSCAKYLGCANLEAPRADELTLNVHESRDNFIFRTHVLIEFLNPTKNIRSTPSTPDLSDDDNFRGFSGLS